MVVQCPTCQSKFRIADDKVTDRGVRVRCTSCKNVFQVRKPGAAASDAAPGPGNTMDLSSLGAAAVARAGVAARPGAAAASKPAPARPAASRPPPAASRPPAAAARSTNGTARRLDADDLFGMAELTGDAPLDNGAPSKPPAAAKPPPKPMPNFDDIDIDVPDEPSGPPPPPPPAASKPPPPPPKTRPPPPPKAAEPPPPPPADEPEPPPQDEAGAPADGAPVKLGAFKSPALKDPFEGMNLGEPGTGAIEISTQPKKDKLAEAAAATPKTEPLPPPQPEIPPGRELVSSALTGLVGAALAIAVVIVAALSDDTSAGWLGFVRGNEIVATRVVSGLYDTASGKPVFYIRGRVENRGQKIHGPIRVTAELVSEGAAEAKAEAIAGAEPSPEDVWGLRSAADVDKLNHSLQVTPAERKLQPGTSLPFFAVIADPPQDLQRHRLHVRVESVDAWTPPPPRKGK